MSNLNDNALIQIFLPILQSGLIAAGFATAIVKQSNQPTQQGANTVPTCYFFKVADKRYGYLGRYDKWDVISSQMVHTENQYFESTWQVGALVLQNPKDLTIPTASDLVNEAAWIMQSDATRQTLNTNGIGILRISDIVNPYFRDDRDNFEAFPSFDFTLVYEQQRIIQDPIITDYDIDIIGV